MVRYRWPFFIASYTVSDFNIAKWNLYNQIDAREPSHTCNYRNYIWKFMGKRFPSDILVPIKVHLANVTFILVAFHHIKTLLWWHTKFKFFFFGMGEIRTADTSWHTINCYKFTPPNALDYQYQAADVSLKGGFYPIHCTLLCTWMPFLYVRK